jgi:hypothetical protein
MIPPRFASDVDGVSAFAIALSSVMIAIHILAESAMGQTDFVELRLEQLQGDRDKIDAQLAQKQLEMLELHGGAPGDGHE